jgi:UDP-GlcNAc3NAcA epimerase
LTIIEPVGYLEMVWLINNCDLVMTDSGGLQKEAYFFGRLCVTLRDETEWLELIENGFNVLAGANKEIILDLYENFRFNKDFSLDLYGQGDAGSTIVKGLLG